LRNPLQSHKSVPDTRELISRPHPEPHGRRHRHVSKRTSALVVSGLTAPEARRQIVFDRLALVLDPNEVVLSSETGLVRIVIANGRVMAAQFKTPDVEAITFDFRYESASAEAAVALVSRLSDFCLRAVDVVVKESPISGVFADQGGLALRDVLFDETAYRAALRPVARQGSEPGAGDPVTADSGPDAPAAMSANPAAAAQSQKVDPASLPLAVLARGRDVVQDVVIHSVAGHAALPEPFAADTFSSDLGTGALQSWYKAASTAIGDRLMIVMTPADGQDTLTVVALDGQTTASFRCDRQALGKLCRLALDLI